MRGLILFISLFGAYTLTGCQAVIDNIHPKGTEVVPAPVPPSAADPITAYRVGDRFYVASVLTNLFIPPGVSNANVTNLNNLIRSGVENQIMDFGGPCDTNLGSGFGYFSYGIDCRFEVALAQAPAFSFPTSIRGAMVLKTILSAFTPSAEEMPLRNAVAIARGTSYANTSIGSLTEPTEAEISRLFSAIYSGTEASGESVQKIRAYYQVMQQQYGHLEAWRNMLLLMLSTLIWQIP